MVRDKEEVGFGSSNTVYVACPPGKKVIGGGADGWPMQIQSSSPWGENNNVWEGSAYNGSINTEELRVYAICANVTP